MADIAALKAQQQQLAAERDAVREENASNFEYVAMIKEKSVLKARTIVLVALAAAAVLIVATLVVHLALPEINPMWMWVTVGVPAIAAIAYTIVVLARHEKYTEIYKNLDRDLGDVRARLFRLDRQIEALQKQIEQSEDGSENPKEE